MTAARVNQSALARTLGVSRQAIHDLIRRGILQPDEAGTFDVDQSRAVITERVRPSGKAATAAAAASATTATTTPTAPAAAAQQQPETPQPDQQLSYHVAKTLREAAEARMAQLKLAEMQRRLIQAEPAISAIYTAFRGLRDQCMLLGRKVAPTVTPMTEVREVHAFVDRKMAEILDTYVNNTLPSLVASLQGSPAQLPPDIAAPAAVATAESAAP